MKMNSLRELLIKELRDLHDCETELLDALDKMAERAFNAELRQAFLDHRAQTEGHVRRLETAFQELGEEVSSDKCQGIRGIIKEGESLAKKDGDESAIDAGLIASAQKAEHYEIAAYGTVCAWAEMMGHSRISELLRQTLDEEKMTDEQLTDLAESVINLQAVEAGSPPVHDERYEA